MKLIQNSNASVQQDAANNTVMSLIYSMGLLLCMIFTVLGIKLKWFKHRLSFEHIPGTSSGRNGGGSRSSSSASQNGSITPLEGVFRRKEDADSFIEIERPKTLPPVRIRSTDVQIPVPNRLSQLGFPSSAAQNNSQPPTPPPLPSSSSTLIQRSDNRSQKSSRSQTSSRSKSSERGKKIDEQSTSSIKSSSPRKKKVHDNESSSRHSKRIDDQPAGQSKSPSRKKKPQEDNKFNQPSTSSTSHYSEVNKKRRDKDKEKEKSRTPPSGASYEPRAKPRNAQASTHFEQTRHFEKLKDDKQISKTDKANRIIERRPTGFVRPSEEEMDALGKISELDGKVTLKLDGFSDNDEESQRIFEKVKSIPVPEPRKRTSNETDLLTTPPIASVATKPNDSWSAVARHRILTEELTKQHSALKPVGMDLRSNGMSEFRNPLSISQSTENKPRTMRDMKKTKEVSTSSHNDRVVLGQEQRDDTEA